MRIGVGLLIARSYGWRELRDAAVSVEDAGFDSLWVPDHIERDLGGSRVSLYESVGVLGAIAEATTRVTLGASVHNAAWKHPVHVVHAAATLSEISEGRAVLGVGAGGRLPEHGFVDAPMDYPFSRFAEAVQIIRPLLDGKEVTYEGRFWKTTGARIEGVDEYRIPLLMAAQGPKSIGLAFEYGDIWNAVELSGTPNPSQVEARIAIADEASVVDGRSPQRSVSLMVSPVPIPGMEDANIITGSTSEIIETLASFAKAGFDEVLCYGPAPSTIGSDAWRPIVEAAHAL